MPTPRKKEIEKAILVKKTEKTRLRIDGQCESGPVDINAHPSCMCGLFDLLAGAPIAVVPIASTAASPNRLKGWHAVRLQELVNVRPLAGHDTAFPLCFLPMHQLLPAVDTPHHIPLVRGRLITGWRIMILCAFTPARGDKNTVPSIEKFEQALS